MTNLTTTTPRTFRAIDNRETVVLPASGALWTGAFVELNGSGNLQNLTGTGTTFAGVLLQDASAAADRVELADKCNVRLTVAKGSNWAATDIGATVYASDGNAFTLTSTNNQAIGKVIEIESGTGTTSAVVWVYVEGVGKRSL